jgi:glycosyltransferase involved in cell wall biosynthesis
MGNLLYSPPAAARTVSVIIPVFNGELYLNQCLDSVLAQTLTEIEIICVDDGSTDRSAAILEEYAAKDHRIIVLRQQNKGAGAARNAGMAIAKGEYLSFLDADDFFDRRMLEKQVARCKETGAEIVCCKAYRFDNQLGKITGDLGAQTLAGVLETALFSWKNIDTLYQCCSPTAWGKLFKKSFIDAHNIRFQEIPAGNDAFFVHTALGLCEKITALDEFLVVYRQGHPTSITSTLGKNQRCYYLLIRETVRFLKNHSTHSPPPPDQKTHWEAIEQSYLNWAVSSLFFSLYCVNRTGTGAKDMYSILKNEFISEFEIAEKDKSWFYQALHYDEIQFILTHSIEECILNLFTRVYAERDALALECKRLRPVFFTFRALSKQSKALFLTKVCFLFPWYVYKSCRIIYQNPVTRVRFADLFKACLFFPYFLVKLLAGILRVL